MTVEERHAQVLAECERLVARNGVLEGLLAAERIWRSDASRVLGSITDLLTRAPADG